MQVNTFDDKPTIFICLYIQYTNWVFAVLSFTPSGLLYSTVQYVHMYMYCTLYYTLSIQYGKVVPAALQWHGVLWNLSHGMKILRVRVQMCTHCVWAVVCTLYSMFSNSRFFYSGIVYSGESVNGSSCNYLFFDAALSLSSFLFLSLSAILPWGVQ